MSKQCFYGDINFPKNALNNLEIERTAVKYFGEAEIQRVKRLNSQVIQCSDTLAENGKFLELEKLFMKTGIPFDRYRDSNQEWDSETLKYRPEVNGLPGYNTLVYFNANGNPYVKVSEIRYILAKNNTGDAIKKIKAVLDKADPGIPPIEDYLM